MRNTNADDVIMLGTGVCCTSMSGQYHSGDQYLSSLKRLSSNFLEIDVCQELSNPGAWYKKAKNRDITFRSKAKNEESPALHCSSLLRG